MKEAPCVHCGREAIWDFTNDQKNLIEVVCPDCGRYEIPSLDFEREEFEIVEPVERE
jgi:endogenous inhibitor of DNA gyrase (YacG/DUF329 family)